MTDRTSERIAFIEACWHRDIVDEGRDAFAAEIGKLGVPADLIDFFEVPGSLDIPLQAKLLAKTGKYAIIVAAGFIVDGGIYRHEFVAETVIDAMMQVQLETEVPILSMVLTPQQFHEHEDHRQFFREHLKTKGRETAEACVRTMENLKRVTQAT